MWILKRILIIGLQNVYPLPKLFKFPESYHNEVETNDYYD